ncbi:MAG: hypothetical protein AAGF11_08740 [Myxococcota bacterium]
MLRSLLAVLLSSSPVVRAPDFTRHDSPASLCTVQPASRAALASTESADTAPADDGVLARSGPLVQERQGPKSITPDPSGPSDGVKRQRDASPPCKTKKLRSGKGLLAVGGVLASAAFVGRVSMLAYALSSDNVIDIAVLPILVLGVSAPVAYAGHGFLFGGMYRYGRYQAYQKSFGPAKESVFAARTARWGLLLSKLALLTSVAFTGAAFGVLSRPDGFSNPKKLKTGYSIFYSGIILADLATSIGYMQKGYASGYNRMGWSIMVSALPTASAPSVARAPYVSMRGHF